MKRGVKIVLAVLAVVALLFLIVIPTKTVTIKIDLPPPITAKPVPPAKPVFITMEADSRLTIDGAPTTLEALPRDLSARFGDGPKDQQRVMIRAPTNVSYERFMAVLNTLQEHGWYKVGLVNTELPAPKP